MKSLVSATSTAAPLESVDPVSGPKRGKALRRRKTAPLALEQRLMFDGAGAIEATQQLSLPLESLATERS